MKLFLSVILFLALTNSALASTLIQNCDGLLSIPNRATETYVLTNDINCAGYRQTKAIDFYGELDGQGYRITGLSIEYQNRDIGLFSRVVEGKIIRLMLENIKLKNNDNATTTGLVAGYIEKSTLNDIHVVNSYIDSIDKVSNVGIVAGYVKSSPHLGYLSVSGSQLNVEMANNVGAVIGHLDKSSLHGATLNNNTLTFLGTGRTSLGGVVGKLDNGTLHNVSSVGNTISAPYAEKGEAGLFIGMLVKGQLTKATSDTDSFYVPVKTNHWRPAMAAGFVSSPLSPALMDIKTIGDHTNLDWYNSKDPVLTADLTRTRE